jgi:hypothetical protein
MFGIPIYYFQVKPDPDTADYTFKEYALHNVTKVKQIKLMIPDGQMPSSNPKFSALDFDWELDWDVELSKTEFAVAFGDTEYPKVRDFIYIPLMKRMWEVNSAYDERNESLMWRSSTWKLSLVKYEDSTNVAATEDMTKLIDDLCGLYYDDVFGVKEEIQQERETGSAPLTSPTYAATNLFNIEMQDAVRKKYNKGEISVIDYQYNHRSNIVGRTIYKFKKPESTLVYQNGYCGEEGTLTFIIQTQGQGDTLNNKPIITMGPVKVYMNYQDGQYNISFNGMETSLKQFSSYLVVLRWSKQTYSCNIQIHEYTHEQDTPIYMLRPEMYWFNSKPCFSDMSLYNLDFQAKEKQECFIQAFPTYMTNIKLFDRDLGENDALKEAIKYTTQNKSCIINDLARHFNDGHGYSVR